MAAAYQVASPESLRQRLEAARFDPKSPGTGRDRTGNLGCLHWTAVIRTPRMRAPCPSRPRYAVRAKTIAGGKAALLDPDAMDNYPLEATMPYRYRKISAKQPVDDASASADQHRASMTRSSHRCYERGRCISGIRRPMAAASDVDKEKTTQGIPTGLEAEDTGDIEQP